MVMRQYVFDIEPGDVGKTNAVDAENELGAN